MNAQTASNTQSQQVVPRVANEHCRPGRNRPGLLASLGFAALLLVSAPASALYPAFGNTSTYSILAGSAVTNVGLTTINGNVGISPGIGVPPHFTGFGPGANQVTFGPGSAVHDVDVSAFNAQADNLILFGDVAALPCVGGAFNFLGTGIHELAGSSLPPGVYCADSFHITNGTLTLNGTAAQTWVFQSAADLVITNGHVASLSCNVWWQLTSSGSLDAGSSLIGNALALTSITFAAGASLSGRAFAQTGNVTLSGNAITGCAAGAGGVGGAGGVPTLSEWAMVMLAALLAIAGFAAMRRKAI